MGVSSCFSCLPLPLFLFDAGLFFFFHPCILFFSPPSSLFSVTSRFTHGLLIERENIIQPMWTFVSIVVDDSGNSLKDKGLYSLDNHHGGRKWERDQFSFLDILKRKVGGGERDNIYIYAFNLQIEKVEVLYCNADFSHMRVKCTTTPSENKTINFKVCLLISRQLENCNRFPSTKKMKTVGHSGSNIL